MTIDGNLQGEATPERELADYLGFARAHGATSDSRQWITDLEDMLRVAWTLMTREQLTEFRGHPDILAIEEAAGGTAAPP